MLFSHRVEAYLKSLRVLSPLTSLLIPLSVSIPKAVEEIYFNSSATTDLSRLSDLIGVLLKALETSPGAVTAKSVQRLTEMIERAASTEIYSASASHEVVISLAKDYLRLASEMINPDMAAQWMDSSESEVSHSYKTTSETATTILNLMLRCMYDTVALPGGRYTSGMV